MPAVADGRYLLGPVLGRGGMATVYAAVDQHLRLLRALKILDGPFLRSDRARARFEREARTMARLRHPHVLPVHDLVMEAHVCLLVTDLAWHGNLDQRLLRAGPLALHDVLDLGEKIGRALHAAHQRDIVHRDVKPANILIDARGQPCLADFGVVRVPSRGAPMTRPGATLGTVNYMAPEQQADAASVDGRADVFALGRTLLRAATGVSGAPSREALLALPPGLARALVGALRADREQRTASAALLVEQLAAARAGLPPRDPATPGLADLPFDTVRERVWRQIGPQEDAPSAWREALANLAAPEDPGSAPIRG